MWRGAEGRHAPGRGGCTGTARTVLLLQERAVQAAWWSTHGGHTHTVQHEATDKKTRT